MLKTTSSGQMNLLETTKGYKNEVVVAWAEVDEKDKTNEGDNKEDAAALSEVDEKHETTKGDNKEDTAASAEEDEKNEKKVTGRRRRPHRHQQKWSRRKRSKTTRISRRRHQNEWRML